MPTNPDKTGRTRLKAEEVEKALRESYGVISAAARILNVAWSTVDKFVQDNEKVREAKREGEERIKDTAENQLYKKVHEGNLTAIIFFLKTKAKDRGYIESVDSMIDLKGGGAPIAISIGGKKLPPIKRNGANGDRVKKEARRVPGKSGRGKAQS